MLIETEKQKIPHALAILCELIWHLKIFLLPITKFKALMLFMALFHKKEDGYIHEIKRVAKYRGQTLVGDDSLNQCTINFG